MICSLVFYALITGLDYIMECHTIDNNLLEPRVRCYLCHSCVSMDQTVPHITGIRHRMKYMVSLSKSG